MIAGMVLTIAFLLLGMPNGQAIGHPAKLEIRSHYQWSNEPLTTDLVGDLDPTWLNPHLRRWFLHRHVRLLQGKTVRSPSGYGYELRGLELKTVGYGRALQSGWYQQLHSFPCSARPDDLEGFEGFATWEGSQHAAAWAAHQWEELVSFQTSRLVIQLARIQSATSARAQLLGLECIDSWSQTLDAAWRSQIRRSVRLKEWKDYQTQAAEQNLCLDKKVLDSPLNLLNQLTQARTPTPRALGLPLARLPSRRWRGQFSVHTSLLIQNLILNGKFLIDSSARHSTVSPQWLKAQGVHFVPERLNDGLGIRVDEARLGRYTLPFREFLLKESQDLFGPPREVAACCDGVLGLDFLRRQPVEFRSTLPFEVILYPRAQFDPQDWNKFRPSDKSLLPLLGMERETGEWVSPAILPLVNSTHPSAWQWSIGESIFTRTKKLPARSEGVLGVHYTSGGGSFILDIPHGKVWLEPFPKHQHRDYPANRTGLSLHYDFRNGDRALLVTAIRPASPAYRALHPRMRVGHAILEIDEIPVSDLDEWQVERHLAGDYGTQVKLSWTTVISPKRNVPRWSATIATRDLRL